MAKFDPLEDVKIVDNKDDEKKKLFDKKKKKKDNNPPAPPAPAAAKPAPAPALKAAAPAKPQLDGGKKYRVLKDCLVSINDRVTRIRAGKILDARRYGGPAGLERLLATGVEVEEC